MARTILNVDEMLRHLSARMYPEALSNRPGAILEIGGCHETSFGAPPSMRRTCSYCKGTVRDAKSACAGCGAND